MAASLDLRRTIPADATIAQWQASDGWALRCFHRPTAAVPPRGSILFQGGRGDIFEKYLETFAGWHDQGWNVTSFDWRGQGGSGRLTPAANCGDIVDFAEYIADFRVFYDEWVANTPAPHVVMGDSMGGHLVLRALVEGVAQPDAAVLVAPMLGVRSIFGRFAEHAARFMASLGDPLRPAWKGNEKPYTTETRANLLTHDLDRYADEIWWQTENPAILTGPPSWRWLIQAFQSMRGLEAGPVESMQVPTLLLVADADGLVDARVALRVGARLPDAQIVRFGKESAHEILREADPVRDRALDAIDRFLAERAPRA